MGALLSASTPGLAEMLTGVSGWAERAGDRRTMLADAGSRFVANESPRIFSQQGPGWAPKGSMALPGPLLDLSGKLRNSPEYRVWGDNVLVGSTVQYAGTHQGGPRGGATTIKANGQKYMFLPMPSLSSAEYRLPPGSFLNTFIKRSAAGKLIMWQRLPGHTIRPLFLLRTSVRIPARPYLFWTDVFVMVEGGRWLGYVINGRFDGDTSGQLPNMYGGGIGVAA